MIAWKDSMQPSEIYAVASYILTLRGTDPPNPKAPENEITTPSVDASMFE
jgi:cytochrome c oxidase cbb3-type subunit 3